MMAFRSAITMKQNGRHVYGRVLRAFVSLADVSFHEDLAALIWKTIVDYEVTNTRLATIILYYTPILLSDHG